MNTFVEFEDVASAIKSDAQYIKLQLNNEISKDILELSNREVLDIHLIDFLDYERMEYDYDINPDNEKYHYTRTFQLLAQLPNLTTLTFKAKPILTKLPTALGEITQLQHLLVSAYTTDFLALKPLKSLVSLDLKSSKTSINTLIDLLIDIKPLQTLILRSYLKAIPSTIQKLENLQKLEIHKPEAKNHKSIIKQLCQLNNLKELYYGCDGNTYELPEEIIGLKSIESLELHFPKSSKTIKLPKSLLQCPDVFIKTAHPTFQKHHEFLEKYQDIGLEPPFKNIIHAILTDQRQWLEALLENPFKGKDYDPKQSNFFIAGRTNKMGFVKVEIKELLISYGSKVTTKINDKVTHLLLGSGITTKVIDQIIQNPNIKIVLDDHFRQYTLDQEDNFLIENDDNELNDRVLELLFSSSDTNIEIGLSMLEAGGASHQTMTVVLLLMLTNGDKEIRKSARKIFRQHASLDLKDHVKKHKKLIDQYQLSKQSILYNHPEIDPYTYIITKQYYSESLSLNDYPLDKIPDMIGLLTDIKTIHLNDSKNLDWDTTFIQLSKLPNLEELSLRNCNLSSIPKNIALLKNLKQLDVMNNNIKSIEDVSQLPQLERLTINHNPLDSLPKNLTINILDAQNCGIKAIPSDANWKKCTELHFAYNKIKSFPASICFDALEEIDLSDNLLLDEVILDHKYTPKLKEVNLDNNKLKKASLKGLPNLEGLSFSNNQLESLDIEGAFPKLRRLHFPSNKLKKASIKGLPSLTDLNLSNNQITALDIADFPELTVLRLAENKLQEIDLSPFSKLGVIFLEKNLLSKMTLDLPDLYQIDLANNQLTDIAFLAKCPSLLFINLFYNNQITDLSPLKDLDIKNISFDPHPDIDHKVFDEFKKSSFKIRCEHGQKMESYTYMPLWYLRRHKDYDFDPKADMSNPPKFEEVWDLMRMRKFTPAKELAKKEGWDIKIFNMYRSLIK